ncbi:MAG: hypothetical protein COB98_04200 [Flavobacteriaceae bacterium]|nr:MAG: hypothetical protein COB98_04200 [Flavobacteriaceae bacterium]
MTNKTKIHQHDLWDTPWGYAESFLIAFGLLVTGFVMEATLGLQTAVSLVFPYNLILLVVYIGVLIALYKWASHHPIVRWLSKVPASITSIVFVTLLVMIMGIIPQISSDNYLVNLLGLNHITTNWAFLLIIGLFLTCLGLVSVKRIAQFSTDNVGFILNHIGLFLALTAGILGSGDIQRVSIELKENIANYTATDQATGQPVELSFAMLLKDFKLEEYAPKLALIDNESGEILHNQGKNLYQISEGEKYTFEGFEIEVLSYLPMSAPFGGRYLRVNEQGASPAALLKVTTTATDTSIENWISCGSFAQQYRSLKISDKYSLVMSIPEAKKFSSELEVLTRDGERYTTIIEVNKAHSHDLWEIYQLDYNKRMGKWSTTSVIELVRDPWLPVIYTGIFMMIFGAFYMFWVGNKITKKD